MDYREYNDYELVYQVRENDEIAYDLLLKKYSKLIYKLAGEYYCKTKYLGLDFDDIYQEGMMGVIMALNDYNSNDTLLYTYVLVCARREIERLIKTAGRQKHVFLNEAVSINSLAPEKDDVYIEELLPSKYNLEDEFYGDELYRNINSIKYDLPFLDANILELKINSFSIKEIATLLDLSYKVVNNHLHKIRRIIKDKILKYV